MSENFLISIILVLSPLLIFTWINLFYLIFNRKKDPNQELSLLAISSLYLTALVPLGLFVGFHLDNAKIKSINQFKYSKSIRSNGNLIFIISIFSTLFSIYNLTQK